MNFKKIIQKYSAYIVAAALFVAAACIYCSPILSGRKLYAGDIQNYLGASQESRDYHNGTGDYTFWNGAMFSGMPNYQIGGGRIASDSLLAPLSRTFSHRDNPIRMLILYLVCFFIMMRAFGIGRWMSIVGSFAVTLSSYFLVIIPAGHFTKVTSIALCGVVVGAFHLIFRKKYLLGAVLTMVFVALSFKPHPQMFYYFCMLMGTMWIAEAVCHIREKRWKDFGLATAVFVLATFIGLGTGTSNVFANAEYASETMRGRQTDLVGDVTPGNASVQKGLDLDYATQWSYGIDETMSFLIPGFKGGANSIDVGRGSTLYRELTSQGVSARMAGDFCANAPMYWGDQPFTAGNVYMGAIVCFLFVLGLFIVKGPYKWALLCATLMSVFLAWGHNFMWLTELFFKYFPMYSKFRAVSSILVVAEVAMPLLGFLALKEYVGGGLDRKYLTRKMWISAAITAGICLFFALFGPALYDFTSAGDASFAGQLPDWAYAAICDQRAELFRTDSLRSAAFIAAAAVLLWLCIRGRLKKGLSVAILGVLIVADMWGVDRRYFNDGNFVNARQAGSNAFEMQDYEAQILQDNDYFRVFNLTVNPFSDSRTSYRLKSIGGYSAAKLRRYNDLIEEHLSKMHLPVINMLNTRYIITGSEDGGTLVQYNPDAQGNAWFVDRLNVVDNANAESDALNSIDLTHEAVLDKSFAGYLPDYSPSIPEDATVVLNSYSPKNLDYTYSTSAPGTMVFSEIYYPYGWKATLDGESIDHYRVNYLLRAVNVPAGTHNIHFTFDPDSIRKGNVIATVCIVIMYAFMLGAIVFGIMSFARKKKEECCQ